MELNKIEEKESVNSFSVTDLGLALWMNGQIFFNKDLIFEDPSNTVYFQDNVILAVTNDWKDSVYFDLAGRTKSILKDIGGIETFLDKSSALYNKWNDDYTQSVTQRIDLLSGEVIWEKETFFEKPYFSDGHLFGAMESKLYRIEPDTGDIVWQVNLVDKYGSYLSNGLKYPMDVQSYIGVSGGRIYFKAGNRHVLGLDIESNEEELFYEYLEEDVILDNLRLDSHKNVIFSLGARKYFELNLNNSKTRIISIDTPSKLTNFEFSRLGSWDDNVLFFWEGSRNDSFGILDRNSIEIKLSADLNFDGKTGIKQIQHHNSKLYILDLKNCLHVFDIIDF